MPPESRDAAALWDMLQACRSAIDFTQGKSEQNYRGDRILRSAVERQIEIIGEAARRISEPYRSLHPEVPWSKIIEQRNFLTHVYDKVDDHKIWLVVEVDIPKLTAQLDPLVSSLTSDAKFAAEIKALVQKSPRILITGHERPDGDCIGSEVGLCSTLRAAGFNASIINADPVPTRYEFLNEGGMVRQGSPSETFEADLLFVVDSTDLRRLGKLKRENFKVADVIDIDHHLENPHFGKVNWVETHASSTAELIFRLVSAAGWKIPLVGLKALYAGIVTDTGQFCYSNTSPRVLKIAASLIEQGVDPEEMWKRIYLNKTAAELALESRARANMEIRANGQICSIGLRYSDFTETGTTSQHTEEFAGIPRSVEGVKLALFMYEIEEGRATKVSVRTMQGLDATKVAKAFGGGGHRQAAGCTLPFKLDEAKARVFAEAEKLL